MVQILFFDLVKTLKFVILCVFFFFANFLKTVLGINSLAGLFEITDLVFSSFNRHHHTTANASTPTLTQPTEQRRHHIPPHTTTYYHILPHTNTTKHNTHFQHRYRPTFQVARGLHRKQKDSSFLHDANMSDRQGMGHGPCTLVLGASQSCAYTESRLDV